MTVPPKPRTAKPAPRIAGLVLAAGRGARFRDAEAPKPLARIAGETLVARTTRIVTAAGADPVMVVVGHCGDAVAEAIADAAFNSVHVVHAADWRQGVSASIRAGIEALVDLDETPPAGAKGPAIDAVLLMPVDQPGIDVAHLASLVARFDEARPDAVAVRAADGHRRGAPALFARHVLPRLTTLEGDTGARDLLREGRGLTVEVVDLPRRALVDVDTADALARFVREHTAGC